MVEKERSGGTKKREFKRVAFIGHRSAPKGKIEGRLLNAVDNAVKEGYSVFTMGVRGSFDEAAYEACSVKKRDGANLKIELVVTAASDDGKRKRAYSDAERVIYEVEEKHYKRRIVESNKIMVECSDMLVCYVDDSREKSCSKAIMNYAIKKGLKIVNLFRREDDEFFGLTKKEREAKMRELWRTLGTDEDEKG